MTIIEEIPEDSYEGRWELSLVTKTSSFTISFGSGEPEDMNLARDLNDVFSISDMLIAAYNAGARGETLEFV